MTILRLNLSFPVSVGSETTLTISHPTDSKLTQKELRRLVDGNPTTCVHLEHDISADSTFSIRASFGEQCRAVTSVNIVTEDSPLPSAVEISVEQIDLCSEFQDEAMTHCNKPPELSTFITFSCSDEESKAIEVSVPSSLSICELTIVYEHKQSKILLLLTILDCELILLASVCMCVVARFE